MTTNYKIIGLTQDVTTCDCCGKKNLSKTVVLDNGETTVFFGTQCAALTLRGTKKQAKNIETVANEIRLANKWLDKGYTIEQVRQGLVNRGYIQGLQIKENHIMFRDNGNMVTIR